MESPLWARPECVVREGMLGAAVAGCKPAPCGEIHRTCGKIPGCAFPGESVRSQNARRHNRGRTSRSAVLAARQAPLSFLADRGRRAESRGRDLRIRGGVL